MLDVGCWMFKALVGLASGLFRVDLIREREAFGSHLLFALDS